MDALEAIRERRSIRKYKPDAIPKEMLEQLVDAGRLAATARNEQPWEFVVVTDKEVLKKLGGLADHGPFIADAAACIAVFCKDGKYYLEDGCAATENILIAVAALHLGACWVAGDKKPYCPAVAELLGVPEGYRLISLLALGYEVEPTPVKKKRELSDVIHWEKFGE